MQFHTVPGFGSQLLPPHTIPGKFHCFAQTVGPWQARNPREGGELFALPENFKTLHSNFDICRNFQKIKMKFYILIFL